MEEYHLNIYQGRVKLIHQVMKTEVGDGEDKQWRVPDPRPQSSHPQPWRQISPTFTSIEVSSLPICRHRGNIMSSPPNFHVYRICNEWDMEFWSDGSEGMDLRLRVWWLSQYSQKNFRDYCHRCSFAVALRCELQSLICFELLFPFFWDDDAWRGPERLQNRYTSNLENVGTTGHTPAGSILILEMLLVVNGKLCGYHDIEANVYSCTARGWADTLLHNCAFP